MASIESTTRTESPAVIKATTCLVDALARRMIRRGLVQLDDHMLNDIGLSRRDLTPGRFKAMWSRR